MRRTDLNRRGVSLAILGSGLAVCSALRAQTAASARIIVGPDRILTYGSLRVPCVVGGKGIARAKREGDGTTPVGQFPLRRLFYRSDRLSGINTALPARPLNRDDAWCDDPKAADYNKLVRLPFAGHTEALWREDHLYDVLIVLGYNDDPVVPGRGSAIFLHVASPGLAITNGCIAIALPALLEVARRCDATTVVDVVRV